LVNFVLIGNFNINVTEGSFAVGNGVKRDFILVKLAGKRDISRYTAEAITVFRDMNVKSGRANCWMRPVILFSTKKMNTLAF